MHITLTGIDSKTDLSKLKTRPYTHFANRVEYGILLSANPKSNRYPTVDQIKIMLSSIDSTVDLAVHVCGKTARENALKEDYTEIFYNRNVCRIQVNGKVTPEELTAFCYKFPYHTIITQDCPDNIELAQIRLQNHSILLDASGGRGVVRKNWDIPEHLLATAEAGKKRIGFAGGLGEDNLAEVFPLISTDVPLDPWVDMETKLRDENDWFDIEKAHRCAKLVERKI